MREEATAVREKVLVEERVREGEGERGRGGWRGHP
jgi:hypothetical protein